MAQPFAGSLWRTSPDRNNPTDKEKTMGAKLFNYFDDYESVVLECHKCHWKCTYKQGPVEYHAELADCSCPNCDFFDAPMSSPTPEEALAHSDRPGIREWVQAIDRDLDEFAPQKTTNTRTAFRDQRRKFHVGLGF
jgi:hypothetical protein